MASLGFRPPQFSEDVAWLPAWLQQHQAESFHEHISGPQAPSEQAFQDFAGIQGNISKNASMLSSEEGRYNSCHLFLSGDDSSPLSFASFPRNVLHFHLHLSSDDSSQNISSPLSEQIQVDRPESNKFCPMQHVEASAGEGKKVNESKKNYAKGVANLLPSDSNPKALEYGSPQHLTHNKDSGRQCDEKFDDKHLQIDDISAAIELSIAASEALAVHELVKREPHSDAFPAAAVLEVALRVKQARSEGPESASLCLAEEVDEFDSLSDLDEYAMADAFEDVGLSLIGLDDLYFSSSVISQVEDAPISGNPSGCDDKVKNIGLGLHGTDPYGTIMKEKAKDALDMDLPSKNDLPLESHGGKGRENLCDYQSLQLGTSFHINGAQQELIQEGSDVAVTVRQGDALVVGDVTSFQTHQNLNSHPQARDSENSGQEDKMNNLVPSRFRSRWLGGWSRKEVDGTATIQQSNTKSIAQIFVAETSFLSETADIAPDVNSFVRDQEIGLRIASQSSVPFGSLYNKASEGDLLSQDVMRSPSLSLSDPLCSIVPCSINSENVGVTQAPNQSDREIDVEKHLCMTSEFRKENLNVEFVDGNGQAVPATNVESSGATVFRQITSLKAYSMLLPFHGAVLEKGSSHYNQSLSSECNLGLLSSEKNKGCSVSLSKRFSTDFLSSKSISNGTAATDYVPNHETHFIGSAFTKFENQKTKYDENAEDGAGFHISDVNAKDGTELQVHPHEERNLPIILNHRVCRRVRASKISIGNFSVEKDAVRAATSGTEVNQQNKSLQTRQGKCCDPHDIQVPMRKRVRFSEVEAQNQQHKNLRKQQSAHKICSSNKAGKRLKHSNKLSDSRTLGVKMRLRNYCVKDGKRLLFQGIEFLLTGFSTKKEKEIEELIRKYGGTVLSDIPSPPNPRGKRKSRSSWQRHPIVLCIKKLETMKFLYGCAVDAFILKPNWLTESIATGSILPPEKFMILSNKADGKYARIGKPFRQINHKYIFERVGIMLHGKHSFCIKLAEVFKHGGGTVFKTLKWLVSSLDADKISVGAIVAEDESRASRHLRHCALERKIPMMPVSWIISSLHLGELLPFPEKNLSHLSTAVKPGKVPAFPVPTEFSEEI
ncbi:uncharacterized protein LOC131163672 [Malania oleifera]|uniref:uncharacterized protein LOC131163672 n=1 Tax=Malania oleifera TaxID=397392 RepID=UPI0025AE874A|nr:uncharacterized protein LOC131163672 [Malania oleifera]